MKKPPYIDEEHKYEKHIKGDLDFGADIFKYNKNEKKFADLYGGPPKKDDFWHKPNYDEKQREYDYDLEEGILAEKRKRQIMAYRAKVGCVITQPGLEGALVLEYVPQPDTTSDPYFKIRLRSGTITTGTWDRMWDHGSRQDPPGFTSCGWTVGDIKPEIFDDEVPF